MPSPRTRSLKSVFCLSVVLVGCQTASHGPAGLPKAPPPTRPAGEVIEAGRATDLDLTAGVEWRASFAVAEDSYLQLLVEQRNLDVGVRVLDDENHPLAHVDGEGGIGVDERLSLRLGTGDYHLVLSPRPDGPPKGRVRLTIEVLRPFEPNDSERLRLTLLGQEAAQLDGVSAQRGWERAVALSTEELAGWRQLGDTRAVIRTLLRLVSLERALGLLASSIRRGEEAVRLSLEAGLEAEQAASRYWLAQSLYRAGEVSAAASQFSLGLVAAEKAGDLLLQGRILIWQGRMNHDRGDLLEARRLYQVALELRREAHDTRGIRAANNNLAVIAQELGDFALALDLYRAAIEEARQLGDPGAEILLDNNLAGLLAKRGQWQEALDSLTVGLEKARASDDTRNQSILGKALAELLQTLGEFEPARRLLRRSLELDGARQDGVAEASVLTSLAQLELRLGNLEEAETWMLAAYDLSTRLELGVQKDQVARSLAALRSAQGLPRLALELLEPLVDEAKSSNQPIRLATALKGLGEVYLDLEDSAAALGELTLARQALGDLPVPEIRFEISYLTARARHAEGDLIAAVEEVEQALGMLEKLRLAVDDPELRATFLSRSREAFDFAIARLLDLDRLLPGQGYDRQAFATLERARARSLVEMLARARFGAEGSLNGALLEAERSALAAVNKAREKLRQAAAAGRGEALAIHQAELDAANSALSLAEEALRRAEPRYSSLRYGDNYAVADLQAMLDPGVALIEYSLQPGRSVAFVVTSSHFEVVGLAAEETIEKHTELLRETLVSPNRRAHGTLLSRALLLGNLVISPLSEALAGSRRLIVVPDGALAHIPFEALRLAREGTSDIFLIERWAISYSPSAGVLRTLMLEQGRPQEEGWVAFADPRPPEPPAEDVHRPTAEWQRLPGARREVAAIAASIGHRQATTFIDSEASEHALKWNKRAVGKARWIHLAAHARINHRAPADSAIVLAPGEGDDGYLTVQEIFALELKAELVVLSGCETALGRQIRGEGLIGLTRAFLYAGARGIQVSLWQVSDDSTPALMASFYSSLAQDMGPSEALRAAKLESLADPARSHPFYWAPFVFIGD